MLRPEERAVLRSLAQEYAELASQPIEREKERLWRKLNGRSMERPMVLIDQIPWAEMDVDGRLQNRVDEPYWREVETTLRRQLYQGRHCPADRVFLPYLCLPRPIRNSGYGVAVQQNVAPGLGDVSGHYYIGQFRTLEDVARIQTPVITLDTTLEARIVEEATALFEGILPFRMTGQILHLGLWDTLSMWIGVENVYMDLIDQPEFLHAMMRRLTDCMKSVAVQMDTLGLFDINSQLCHCSHTFSDCPPGPDCDPAHPRARDAWAFGLAQLFTSVSPAVTAEFEVPYMQELFPLFGSIYYGCCDRLDDRLDIIDRMPNIRKISCSPWSKREAFAANLPHKYIMSNKPSPALLARGSVDWDEVRADLRRTIAAARAHGVNLEFILKDISTLRGQPERLWRWSEVALEEMGR